MDINKLVDRLNAELDKLNKLNNVDTNSFFTDNEKFNDDISIEELKEKNEENAENIENKQFYEEDFTGSFKLDTNKYEDIKPDDETKDLISIRERRLLTAQTMFKKSIRISLKSFLISLSLSFLNLFI